LPPPRVADHAVAVADQVDQEIENLGLERNEIAPTAQFAPISIEREILKSEERLEPPRGLLSDERSTSSAG